jgi:hypothetical protein
MVPDVLVCQLITEGHDHAHAHTRTHTQASNAGVHQLLNTVWSRFTTGLRSRIFGYKSNRRKTSTVNWFIL